MNTVEGLTLREREILAACALQADLTAGAIARRVGCSEQSVRAVLRSLIERDLIQQRHYIDVFKLGLSSYVWLFSLRPEHSAERSHIIAQLSAVTEVAWLAEVTGHYDFAVQISNGDVYRAVSLFGRIEDQFGYTFSKKSFAQHLSCTDYSYGFLADRWEERDLIETERASIKPEVDKLDHMILRELSCNPGSKRDLSQKLDLSLSTLQYRLAKLHRSGVLKRSTFRINHEALGYSLSVLLVSANSFGKLLKQRLFQFCLRHPYVTALVQSVGDWDYEISMLIRDPAEISALGASLEAEFSGQLSGIAPLQVKRLIKDNQYPFDEYERYLMSAASNRGEASAGENNSKASDVPERLVGND